MAASGIKKRHSQARASRRRHRLRRPFLDAAGTALLFVMLTSVGTSAPVKAYPFAVAAGGIERSMTSHTMKAIAEDRPAPIIEIATTSSPRNPDAVFRRTSSTTAWVLLGLSLSLLTALNLSIIRHLRRVYVRPKARRAALSATRGGQGY